MGVDVDFGVGSKFLRGVVILEDVGGVVRLVFLGAFLEGRVVFRVGWFLFLKVEFVGGR